MNGTNDGDRNFTMNPPRVSVIVPAYNCVTDLQRCLEAIRQSLYHDCEVVVVDDGSSDLTASTADDLADRVIRMPQQSGPAAARNAGVATAQSEYVVFIDADVCVHLND